MPQVIHHTGQNSTRNPRWLFRLSLRGPNEIRARNLLHASSFDGKDKMKITNSGLALLLSAALCTPLYALGLQDDSAKRDAQNAGHESKNAAKDAGNSAKNGTDKAYNSTRNGTERGYNKTKNGTSKAYHSTRNGTEKGWNKTKNTTKGAYNGGKEGEKNPDSSYPQDSGHQH